MLQRLSCTLSYTAPEVQLAVFLTVWSLAVFPFVCTFFGGAMMLMMMMMMTILGYPPYLVIFSDLLFLFCTAATRKFRFGREIVTG